MSNKQLSKEIEALAHKWIDEAEDTRKKREEAGIEVSFAEAAVATIFFKLAEFDLRIRKLEVAKGRTDDFLNMHTPLGG